MVAKCLQKRRLAPVVSKLQVDLQVTENQEISAIKPTINNGGKKNLKMFKTIL